MSAEWKQLLRGCGDLRVTGEDVEVSFATGRHHTVSVDETEDVYRLSAIVTRTREAAQRANEHLRLWRTHRVVSCVAFQLDKHGRLVGESWTPKAGVTAGELQVLVRTLAAECDRFEHALTGRDVE
jgi:hypothetical protein